MADREKNLENLGLTDKDVAPVPPATPPPAPVATPDVRKTTPWTKTPETKPAEPVKPVVEAPKVFAGKFKSVEDLEKSYLELQKQFHSTPPAERGAQPPATPPPAVPITERSPDPFIEPEKYTEWITTQVTNRAIQAATSVIEGQKQVEALRTRWKALNPDIERLLPEVERAIAQDPRSLQIKNLEELWPIVEEHTERYRALAASFVDLGRTEERNKLSGVSPTAPQVTPEQPSTPPGEGTPAEELDETEQYIAERQAVIEKRRGYGYDHNNPENFEPASKPVPRR